jgi:cytochrome c biogenesis protein ResB
MKVEERFPGCYAKVVERRSGAVHEAMLWSFENPPRFENDVPWPFEVEGVRYGLLLRRRVLDLPFTVRLDEFHKRDHPGTDNARDYSSNVTVLAKEGERPVHIFMNNPLRKDGLVFYQTSWGPQDRREIDPSRPVRYWSMFEVADNPSDQWPKWACYVIAVGLVVHFTSKLRAYIRAQLKSHVPARGAA